MLRNIIVGSVLIAAGCIIWRQRKGWRLRWTPAIWRSLAFQAGGFILCIPGQADYIGRVLFALTGTAHLRDYFGHLCFMCAAADVVCAMMCRLVPQRELEARAARIERPTAVAALIMLIAILGTSNLSDQGHADFFEVPLDGWLDVYWITYWAIIAYLLVYGMRLATVLRQDPQSRGAATMFLIADIIGVTSITLAVAVLILGMAVPDALLWATVSVASILVAGWVSRQLYHRHLASSQ